MFICAQPGPGSFRRGGDGNRVGYVTGKDEHPLVLDRDVSRVAGKASHLMTRLDELLQHMPSGGPGAPKS